MSAEKVVIDAEVWEWLRDSAHHDEGCSGAWQNPDGTWIYRCRCGFRDIEPRLDDAVPVEPYDTGFNEKLWQEVTR